MIEFLTSFIVILMKLPENHICHPLFSSCPVISQLDLNFLLYHISVECGIVAQLVEPIALENISTYYLSTYNNDHCLVRDNHHLMEPLSRPTTTCCLTCNETFLMSHRTSEHIEMDYTFLVVVHKRWNIERNSVTCWKWIVTC